MRSLAFVTVVATVILALSLFLTSSKRRKEQYGEGLPDFNWDQRVRQCEGIGRLMPFGKGKAYVCKTNPNIRKDHKYASDIEMQCCKNTNYDCRKSGIGGIWQAASQGGLQASGYYTEDDGCNLDVFGLDGSEIAVNKINGIWSLNPLLGFGQGDILGGLASLPFMPPAFKTGIKGADAIKGELDDRPRSGGGGGGGGPAPPPAYVPTYSPRQWDAYAWSCPWGTVESGSGDPSKACFNKPYTSQQWRLNSDGKWGWGCPNGTTPNIDDQWEKKCVVGYMGRVLTDEGWKCPSGTKDTGRNWNNAGWVEAQQQCERGGPYTTRVVVNKQWVCPPGSKDTGLNWNSATDQDKDRGWKQCQWVGP